MNTTAYHALIGKLMPLIYIETYYLKEIVQYIKPSSMPNYDNFLNWQI